MGIFEKFKRLLLRLMSCQKPRTLDRPEVFVHYSGPLCRETTWTLNASDVDCMMTTDSLSTCSDSLNGQSTAAEDMSLPQAAGAEAADADFSSLPNDIFDRIVKMAITQKFGHSLGNFRAVSRAWKAAVEEHSAQLWIENESRLPAVCKILPSISTIKLYHHGAANNMLSPLSACTQLTDLQLTAWQPADVGLCKSVDFSYLPSSLRNLVLLDLGVISISSLERLHCPNLIYFECYVCNTVKGNQNDLTVCNGLLAHMPNLKELLIHVPNPFRKATPQRMTAYRRYDFLWGVEDDRSSLFWPPSLRSFSLFCTSWSFINGIQSVVCACHHANWDLLSGHFKNGTVEHGFAMCRVMYVLSRNKAGTINNSCFKYPHWTRVQCGSIGARFESNMLSHASVSTNRSRSVDRISRSCDRSAFHAPCSSGGEYSICSYLDSQLPYDTTKQESRKNGREQRLPECTFWDGETKGNVTKLGGLNAYLSESSTQTGKAIVLLPDIFGWEAKNPRLLADKFAASGFTAVLPDLFRGEPCPVEEMQAKEKPRYKAWMSEHSPVGAAEDTEKVISELCSTYGAKSVGAIGFCWGGTLALHLGTGDKVNAVIMNHGGPTTAEKVQAVKQPFMVNGSDNDNSIPKALLDEIKSVLDSKHDVPSDVKFFCGSFHGWTCRGDVSDPKMGPLVVDAHERATSWFNKHL